MKKNMTPREGKKIKERLSMTFTANGKNETFAVCLQLSVQENQNICICS